MELKELNLLFTFSKENKVYTLCTENIKRILIKHTLFKNRLRFDDFRKIMEISFEPDKWLEVTDQHIIRLQGEIACTFTFFQRVSKTMMQDAVLDASMENKYDSAQDYLKSLKWDNTTRLDTWLTHVYGVEENEYHKKVGANWIKGMVKRIMQPGCKFDYILVLEGPQGSRKSSSLAALGQNWHVETVMNADNKDFFMQFQGKAIIEFSEGETLSRTDVKRMKAIITTQVDRFRPPYARNAEDFPRRCVFAMTTNESEYLKDDTGNRRWLPVTLNKEEADTDWIEENRDQLLAEAYYRVIEKKETIYEFPKEETLLQQSRRMEVNPNREIVEDWYWNTLNANDRAEGITTAYIYTNVMNKGFPNKPIDRYHEMIIAGILKHIGLEKKQTMNRGIRMMRWFQKFNIEPTTTLKVTTKAIHAPQNADEIPF